MELNKPEKKEPCEHDWKETKEIIYPEERKSPKIPPFIGSHAYFIKKECTKCPAKMTTDYVVVK